MSSQIPVSRSVPIGRGPIPRNTPPLFSWPGSVPGPAQRANPFGNYVAPRIEGPTMNPSDIALQAPAVQAATQAAKSGAGDKANPSHPNAPASAPPRPTSRPSASMRGPGGYRGTFVSSGGADSWNPSGRPLSQGQLIQDFAAREALNARHAQALDAIQMDEEARGDPMEKKLRAEALNAAYEEIMPMPAPSTVQAGPDGVFRNSQEPPFRRGQAIDHAYRSAEIRERSEMMKNLAEAGEQLRQAQASGNEQAIGVAQGTYERLLELAKLRGTLMSERNLGFYGQPDFGAMAGPTR